MRLKGFPVRDGSAFSLQLCGVRERAACGALEALQGCIMYRISAWVTEEALTGSRWDVASPSQQQDAFLAVPSCTSGYPHPHPSAFPKVGGTGGPSACCSSPSCTLLCVPTAAVTPCTSPRVPQAVPMDLRIGQRVVKPGSDTALLALKHTQQLQHQLFLASLHQQQVEQLAHQHVRVWMLLKNYFFPHRACSSWCCVRLLA